MTLHVAGHDGTDRGDDALALADRFAGLYGADLLVVHVVPMPPIRDQFTGPVLEQLEHEAGAVLARASARMASQGPEPRTVFAPSAAAGLQEVCAGEGAALVTIGPSHRGPIGRILAGTTGDRLLSGAPCPVALAPRGYAAAEERLEKVTVGYDGSPEAQTALEVAADVARRAGVVLHVIAVAERATVSRAAAAAGADAFDSAMREHAEQLVAEALGRVPSAVSTRGEVIAGEPGPALASAVGGGSDLLIIGSRRYGPARSVLAGSVGHHLARASTAPVLLVPRGVELDQPGDLLGVAAGAA
jgi:nucleotide-binding universal stress UspA family protein